MYWFSIIYFFTVTVLSGTIIDLLVRNWEGDWLEKLVMRFGVGLAAISVIGVILNLLNIPLDYRVFFVAGLLITIGALVKNSPILPIGKEQILRALSTCWKGKKFWFALLMCALFAVTVNMYVKGSFRYTYFEDTDPWGYTVVADYIGENKTFSGPYHAVHYSEPYTQGYQIVMGVLSQTNDSIYWTMKFFNALIISFGVLFMYYFARRFSRNEEVALLAGIFLFAVPSWVSHFVFSLHFNMTIFVVMLYILAQLMPGVTADGSSIENQQYTTSMADSERLSRSGDKGWLWVGIIIYASMLVNHFSTSVHATVFGLVFIVTRALAEKKIDWHTIAVFIGGALLSLLFFVPAYARHWWLTSTSLELGGMEKLFPLMRFITTPSGMITVAAGLAIIVALFWKRSSWQPAVEKWINFGDRGMILWLCGLALVLFVLLLPIEISQRFGTGDKYYGIKDFFSASSINLMNNPIGLGPIVMSAVLASFLLASVQIKKWFKIDNAWIAISYAWIITAFLLVLGKYLSVAIAPFRAWTFLGFFASLFAAWGCVTFVHALTDNRWVLRGIIVVLAIMVVPTTFLPKRQLNTMVWQDHTIGAPESQELFNWMREGGIPKNSVVAHLCGNSEFLSGYDMNPPVWDEVFHPERGTRQPYFVTHPLDMTPEAYSVLKNAKVEYVTLGASCLWQAPVPAEQEFSYGLLLRDKMDGYAADSRLTVIKNTGLEVLLRLN